MDIKIGGVIGMEPEEGTDYVSTADGLSKALEGISDDEEIVIIGESGGGSVFEGYNMYNDLKRRPNPIKTQVSTAMSIMTLIALAADEVETNEISQWMIHNASGMAQGTKEEMAKQGEILASIDKVLISVYVAKTGKSEEEIKEMMNKETWFTGTEAVEMGFADKVINKLTPEMAAMFNINKKQMELKKFWNSITNEGDVAAVEPEAVEKTEEEKEEEAKKKAEEEEKKKAEEEEKKKEEEAKNYATKEEFSALVTAVSKLTDQIEQSISASAKDEATKAVNELKASLKRSNGVTPTANASLNSDPTVGYVDPYAAFRAQMKEIDDATRPEKK